MAALGLSLVARCATLHSRWARTESLNTTDAYEQFIARYPQDTWSTREARRRTSDDDHAFYSTCRIGTLQAFQGYVASHPSGYYTPVAKVRIEYLAATRLGDLASYRRFITDHEWNPFALEALATFPTLWLARLQGRIGVVTEVDSLVRLRGLLRASQTERSLRDRLSNELVGQLRSQGFECMRLDSGDFHMEDCYRERAAVRSISVVVVRKYGEVAVHPSATYHSSSPYVPGESYMSRTLQDAAAANLASILVSPINSTSSYVITDSTNRTAYYWGVPDLTSAVNKRNTLSALARFAGDERIIPSLVVASNNKDHSVADPAVWMLHAEGNGGFSHMARMLGSAAPDVREFVARVMRQTKDVRGIEPLIEALDDEDESVRRTALEALEAITDERFGPDPAKWREWRQTQQQR